MPEPAALPPLESCGFVRVPPAEPGSDPRAKAKPYWMKCEKCGKADHFWMEGGVVRCRCGAIWSHAIRPDGQQVPAKDLIFTPFQQGPMSLADLEWDPLRLTLAAIVGLAALGGVVGLLLWGFR